MDAVVLALFGVVVMAVLLGVGAVFVRRQDRVHHVVAEHGFAPWPDVWRLSGRVLAGVPLGQATECQRALVAGVPVELLRELPAGRHRARTSWLVAAQVDRRWTFSVVDGRVSGVLPPAGGQWLAQASAARPIGAVTCADGLLVVRTDAPSGIEPALDLLVRCVHALGARG